MAFPQEIHAPISLVKHKIIEKFGVHLYIKREDLIHKEISGNKWRKLKCNLEEVKAKGYTKILTFGGAFSNHLAATAYAGKIFNLETIGIIRGEKAKKISNTLEKAAEWGMKLHFISREDYKNKLNEIFIKALHQQYGDFYLIPEGGANALGVKGCSEIVSDISIPFDYICCPCGTGTTLAGIINGLQDKAHAIGFSALNADGYFEKEISTWLAKPFNNWSVNDDYHFGGYAKTTTDLKSFIHEFYDSTGIPLDGVYTGKMLYGIIELIKQKYFTKGSTIVAIHTGGLQGNEGLGISF